MTAVESRDQAPSDLVLQFFLVAGRVQAWFFERVNLLFEKSLILFPFCLLGFSGQADDLMVLG